MVIFTNTINAVIYLSIVIIITMIIIIIMIILIILIIKRRRRKDLPYVAKDSDKHS